MDMLLDKMKAIVFILFCFALFLFIVGVVTADDYEFALAAFLPWIIGGVLYLLSTKRKHSRKLVDSEMAQNETRR